MTSVFSGISRVTGVAVAGVLLTLAGCGRQSDPFSNMPQVNDALTAHVQTQAYVKTLRERGVGKVTVHCTYDGNFRSSKGIALSFETKTGPLTHFERLSCDEGGKIVLEPTDSGLKVHSTHAYSNDVLDKQMLKVVALTNEMRANDDLTKHMMAQPYAEVFKTRRIGAIDMVCDSVGGEDYRWKVDFEFPYRTPYPHEPLTCEFGAIIKIRPTLQGYTVSSNTPVSAEDFDKQMALIKEATQEQTSM